MGRKSTKPPPRRTHKTPAIDTLPVVRVADGRDMAVMLARHNRLLRDYARYYLAGLSEYEVEDTVEAAIERLLAIEEPAYAHGLAYATAEVYQECERTRERLA